MKHIFEGLKVVELASVLAGPAVGLFFAELGAEVIKIENKKTGGDVTRTWRLPSEDKAASVSAYYCAINWNKEVQFLDLSTEAGKNAVYELVKEADVVVANYKKQSAKKLGMDYDNLKKIRPDLIYANIDTNDFPFQYANNAKTWWFNTGVNGFLRIELIKNETTVVFSTFHKFSMSDGILTDDEILIPVIDEIITAEAGDHFIWRVSIMPNFNNPSENIPDGFNYNAEGLIIQANTAWVQKEYFDIQSGHWTIFGM